MKTMRRDDAKFAFPIIAKACFYIGPSSAGAELEGDSRFSLLKKGHARLDMPL